MLRERMKRYQARCEEALEARLPTPGTLPARLHDAMRYATLGGGKRIRPVLVYAAGEMLGAPLDTLDGPACALELIHAYSLIHDDLPAMDDDDLRRNKPTVHKAFDEATAILAGDALQTHAFYLLAHDPTLTAPAEARLRMVEALALAAGSRGMCGGQALDLAATGQRLDVVELEDMHIHKTGALIRAAVTLGALTAPHAPEETVARLDHYAKCIGLAFQIRDDILDVEGETSLLGKPAGSDQAHDKATYPALLGLQGAKDRALELHREAEASLAAIDGDTAFLLQLSEFIVERMS
ncbi:(2E,6E)-farnesyl diphosphate synthase [Endothiovibrio diazotrophicus]